ncbi:MAG: outer membrane beta-barrel protein [Lewinella sp.]
MRFPTLTLICLLAFSFTNLSAQTKVGLRVLAGKSSLTSPIDALPPDIGRHDNINSTTFGLVVETKLSNTLSIRSGLQQSQRGTTLRHGTVNELLGALVPLDYEAQVRMNYLEVPLALKLEFPLANDQLAVYGWGGVSAGYALTGSVRGKSASDPVQPMSTSKIAMDNYLFSRYHLGFTGGLGLGLNMGSIVQFRLEAAYDRSAQERNMLSAESGKHGYQLLQFGAGMVFRL